jgi:hypothetical protein
MKFIIPKQVITCDYKDCKNSIMEWQQLHNIAPPLSESNTNFRIKSPFAV